MIKSENSGGKQGQLGVDLTPFLAEALATGCARGVSHRRTAPAAGNPRNGGMLSIPRFLPMAKVRGFRSGQRRRVIE